MLIEKSGLLNAIKILIGSSVLVMLPSTSCNKTDWDSLPFYIRYSLNGETFEGAGFVMDEGDNWAFATSQTECSTDSCIMLSWASFSNPDNNVTLTFDFLNQVNKNELADSNGMWRYKNLLAFSSGLSLGETTLYDGQIYPSVNISYFDGNKGWSLYHYPTGTNPNTSGEYFFKINKLEVYDIEDVPTNSSLNQQVLMWGRGEHVIYLEATFTVKLYSNTGDSFIIEDGKVRTMLVN